MVSGSAASVTVENNTFSGNSASGLVIEGSAVSVTVEDNTISENSATGLVIAGSADRVIVEDNTFYHNFGSYAALSIPESPASVIVHGNEFTENSAISSASGVNITSSGDLEFTDNTMTGNVATLSSSNSLGILNANSGVITVTGNAISDNVSTSGYSPQITFIGKVVNFTGNIVSNNTNEELAASFQGGTVKLLANNGSLQATDNIISGNSGGGLYARSYATVSAVIPVTVSGNQILDNNFSSLAVVCMAYSNVNPTTSVVVENNTIQRNVSSKAGLLISNPFGKVTVDDNDIVDNIALSLDITSSGELKFIDNAVTGNAVTSGGVNSLGSVSAGDSSSITVTGNTISNNYEENAGGFSPQIEFHGKDVTFAENSVNSNTASVSTESMVRLTVHGGTLLAENNAISGNAGGGVYVGASVATSVTIRGNQLLGNGGTGLEIEGTANTVDIVENAIVGNGSAAEDSHAVMTSGASTISLYGNLVYGNTSYSDDVSASCPSISLDASGTVFVINNTISQNTATNDANVVVDAAEAWIINNSVVANGSSPDAPGLSVSADIVKLDNNLIAGNVQGDLDDVAIDAVIANSSFTANIIGHATDESELQDGVDGNIVGIDWTTVVETTADAGETTIPLLADNGGSTKTISLLPNGPAVNAGSSANAVNEDGEPLQFDQRGPGFDRVVGGIVDIGAFESHPVANTPPQIGNLDSSVDYVLGSGALKLDTDVTVTDDSANFCGGSLAIIIQENGTQDDLLTLRYEQGLTVHGHNVLIDGLMIGVYSRNGRESMTITFNSNATPARVQTLMRVVAIESTSTMTDARLVRYVLNDGDASGIVTKEMIVNVHLPNDPPQIGNLDSSVDYVLGSGALKLDTNVTVTDDSANFGGGSLAIILQENGTQDDLLTIRYEQGVMVSGKDVLVNGVKIGEYSRNGRESLTIAFNENATPTRVQTLMQVIAFYTTSTSTDARLVRFVLDDGGYNGVTMAEMTVNVHLPNDPPQIGNLDSSVDYVLGSGALKLDTNVTVTDDSANFGGGSLAIILQENGTQDDLLTIRYEQGVMVSGKDVLVNGVKIGEYSRNGRESLTIAFNENATPARVQTLVQVIAFYTTSTSTDSRLVQFVLDDGGYNGVTTVEMTVNVSSAS